MKEDHLPYLTPTEIIDSHHRSIRDYAARRIGQSKDPVEISVKLYLAVRDGIRYDPYSLFYLPDHYRASEVLRRGRGFCVPKASLLCALGRACGIPSRVGFADVRNHLATRQLIEFVGTDLFIYHGFVEFYLKGKWVKATPAFNRELCERHHVPPLEFNGLEDSLFQTFNSKNDKFMEYVKFHGTHADIPVATIVKAWQEAYGEDRLRNWIKILEKGNGDDLPNFESEDVLDG